MYPLTFRRSCGYIFMFYPLSAYFIFCILHDCLPYVNLLLIQLHGCQNVINVIWFEIWIDLVQCYWQFLFLSVTIQSCYGWHWNLECRFVFVETISPLRISHHHMTIVATTFTVRSLGAMFVRVARGFGGCGNCAGRARARIKHHHSITRVAYDGKDRECVPQRHSGWTRRRLNWHHCGQIEFVFTHNLTIDLLEVNDCAPASRNLLFLLTRTSHVTANSWRHSTVFNFHPKCHKSCRSICPSMYLLAKCHATGHINSVKMSFNSGTMHTLYIHNMNLKYPICMKQSGISNRLYA